MTVGSRDRLFCLLVLYARSSTLNRVKSKAELTLGMVILVDVVSVIFLPIVPREVILAPRCVGLEGETYCPMYLVLQHADVSPSYCLFGFDGVLALPGWSYSFDWTQWRYP